MFRIMVVALVLLLAGCADTGNAPTKAGPAFDEIELQATDTTGVIRCVVVNEAIVPIGGIRVQLLQGGEVLDETVTTESGLCGFDELDPGFYDVRAAGPGYGEQVIQNEVKAGVAEPPVLKFQLVFDAETVPFVNTFVWDAFLECAVKVGTNDVNVMGANVCFILNYYSGQDLTNDRSYQLWYDEFVSLDRFPDHTQVEGFWDSTQDLSESLNIRYESALPDSIFITHVWASEIASSPSVFVIDEAMARVGGLGKANPDAGIEEAQGLALEFFPASHDVVPAGTFLQQDVRMVVNSFYGYTPSEDWTFADEQGVPAPA